MSKVLERRDGAMSEFELFLARIAIGMKPKDAAQATRRARALAEVIAEAVCHVPASKKAKVRT